MLADFPSDTNRAHFLDAAEDAGLRHLVDENGHSHLIQFPEHSKLEALAEEYGALLA